MACSSHSRVSTPFALTPSSHRCVHFYVRAFYLLFHLKSIYFKFRHCKWRVCILYVSYPKIYIFEYTVPAQCKGILFIFIISFLFQGVHEGGEMRIPFTFRRTTGRWATSKRVKTTMCEWREGSDDDDEAVMFDSMLLVDCY